MGESTAKPDRAKAAEEVLAKISATEAGMDTVAVVAFFGAPEATASNDRETRRVQGVKRMEMTAQRWESIPTTLGKKWRELEYSLLKAEGHLGLALQSLQEHVLKDVPRDRSARGKRVPLLRELGWTTWAEREQHLLAVEKGNMPPRF